MKMINKLTKTTLSVSLFLTLGFTSGCSTPNDVNLPSVQQAQNGVTVTSAIANYMDDNGLFSDSQMIASQKQAFSTQQIIIGEKDKEDKEDTDEASASTNTTLTTSLSETLKQSGAVKSETNGQLVLDTDKSLSVISDFSAKLKTELSAQEQTFIQAMTSVRTQLNTKSEVAVNSFTNFRHSKDKVTISDTHQSGGSTYLAIEFDSSNSNTNEEVVVSESINSDTNLKQHNYLLEAKSSSEAKNGFRSVIFNADGSQSVKTKTKRQWSDGTVCEIEEERVIQANGEAKGSGSLKLMKSGQETQTYALETSTNASGELTTQATSAQSEQTIQMKEQASGTVQATIKENGQTTQQSLSIEQEAELKAKS